jgi:hypothetical protein
MKQDSYQKIYSLLDQLKETMCQIEMESNTPVAPPLVAPDRIAIDLTSEDEFGVFCGSRPGEFLNHNTIYVREDMVACDYYESYARNESKLKSLKAVILDITNAREWLKIDFSPEAVRNLDDAISEAREILDV